MLLMTHHRQFVAVSPQGELIQSHLRPGLTLAQVQPEEIGTLVRAGPLSGFSVLAAPGGVRLLRDGRYLCAEPGQRAMRADRDTADDWETFTPVTEQEARRVIPRGTDSERARFAARVADLVAAGQPVKIYCGAGNVPRPGFLNIDVKEYAPEFGIAHPDEYFIFPFADMSWDLPDDCVDYIFHEDFLEHISQLQQIQFLAETLRVLRPGGWHRVNTPNLLWSMRTHSQFRRGFDGVYTGELQWGHVCLVTPLALEELALLVGYRYVVFTGKDGGVSPHAVPDLRPDYDRDPVEGNVFADLQK